MSHMEGTGEISSTTGINNEQQDDVQSTPELLAKDATASKFADIHAVLKSKTDPKKNELPGKPPNHLNEQELEGKVHYVLNLVAILLGLAGHENLINIILRQVAFLWNQEGLSYHQYRSSEYVPKLEKIIEKLSRGYRLDDIIFAVKDLVFLRQLLEHILDSEIISSSLDVKNVNTSSRDAVLEALLEPAPCHSRANANLPAPITEENP